MITNQLQGTDRILYLTKQILKLQKSKDSLAGASEHFATSCSRIVSPFAHNTDSWAKSGSGIVTDGGFGAESDKGL